MAVHQLIVADAQSLYGPGPAFGQGGGAPSLELVARDGEGPGKGRPSMADAPKAAGMVGTLIEDPTFWLVATMGLAYLLAVYSK